GTMIGKVVSDKMQKTVNVAIVRLHAPHPKYHKRFKYTRKFMAHDESEQCGIGDTVRITPCRPLSKRKHFMVQAIM
ncbi:RT17, ribosomal protein 17 mitochondrial small ribosomal subunit, partial [Pelagophyceae sp. CCMP2097]